LSELDLIFINVIFSYFIFHRGNEIKQTCLPMAEFHHTILSFYCAVMILRGFYKEITLKTQEEMEDIDLG
jgi:hypothetical protein